MIHDILSFVKRNKKQYPLMEKIDLYKLLFQKNLLVGHLVTIGDIKDYLNKELKEINNLDDNSLLYEYISECVVRINLKPFLKVYSQERLLDLFYKSSSIETSNNLLNDVKMFALEDIYQDFLGRIPSHSDIYRQSYHPHYRVCASSLLDVDLKTLKLQNFIESVRSDKLTIIALEGRCGSGKTTISKNLKNVTVIELDDHFDSESDPINLEYLEKLLESLEVGNIITEKCYDCHRKSYYYKEKTISNVVVVEGVYGYLERLRKYYDYLGYIVIDKDTQMERIKKRSNYQDFICKWIPREEKYFDSFDFVVNADILI